MDSGIKLKLKNSMKNGKITQKMKNYPNSLHFDKIKNYIVKIKY